jgi:hypothetical protein
MLIVNNTCLGEGELGERITTEVTEVKFLGFMVLRFRILFNIRFLMGAGLLLETQDLASVRDLD